MTINAVRELPLWGLAICFAAQTLLLISATKPADVLQAVNETRLQLADVLIKTSGQIKAIDEELERRGKWMGGIDSELERRTKDRVFRSEVTQLLDELAEQNPDLKIPTLPELEMKTDPPTLQR